MIMWCMGTKRSAYSESSLRCIYSSRPINVCQDSVMFRNKSMSSMQGPCPGDPHTASSLWWGSSHIWRVPILSPQPGATSSVAGNLNCNRQLVQFEWFLGKIQPRSQAFPSFNLASNRQTEWFMGRTGNEAAQKLYCCLYSKSQCYMQYTGQVL